MRTEIWKGGTSHYPAEQAPHSDHRRPNKRGPFENYIAPAMLAADRIDYWVRRQVVPLPDASDPPVRCRARSDLLNQSLNQSVWFSAIRRCLKLQYEDALEAPLPPRLAALISQLETQEASG